MSQPQADGLHAEPVGHETQYERRLAFGYRLLAAHDDFNRAHGVTDPRTDEERAAAVRAYAIAKEPPTG